jgi:hypothetical protein
MKKEQPVLRTTSANIGCPQTFISKVFSSIMVILICKTLSITHENIYSIIPTDYDILGCSVSFNVKSP